MTALTQTNLDNLQKAIANGTLQVEIDGVKRTYRSLDEMLKIEQWLKNNLSGAATTNCGRSSQVSFS